MKPPRYARVAAAALLAATAVGCGSDAGQSKSSFVAHADAICRRANAAAQVITAQVRQAQKGGRPDSVFRRLALLTRRRAAVLAPFVDELDGLATPADDGGTIKAWIAGQRRELTLTRTLATAMQEQDTTRISRLSEQVDALGQAADRFARGYGMPECAQT